MNRLAAAAAVLGFLAVALGAFGAHGLEGRFTAEAEGWWETATLYGLAHAVAALALSFAPRQGFARAGWAFVFGAVLFSGSLYGMALSSPAGGGPRLLGMATPLGGLGFLAGWMLAVAAALKRG